MASFSGVTLLSVQQDGRTEPHPDGSSLTLSLSQHHSGLAVSLIGGGDSRVFEANISSSSECCRAGACCYLLGTSEQSSSCSNMLVFSSQSDCSKFGSIVERISRDSSASVFSERTEESSASQYFQFYSYLSQQQNMMQDYIRTGTYQRAILSNSVDFMDKVVLDVGAGSGILSFFAAQAGARKVYAVEASSISEHAKRLVEFNGLQHVIQLISGKIEEVELPERVDVIISEPMGYMLYNERMLETYLHGKKWLKPGGKMFPSRGDLHIAPFQDDQLYMEQFSKSNFWYQNSFHGVNLSCLRDSAMEEYFRQPVVDTFDVRICLAKSVRHILDFGQAHEQDLHELDIPVEFHILEAGTVHGLAFWFDVAFFGTAESVWLSTAPTEPLTHWYQVRCLLPRPLCVSTGQILSGRVLMKANQRQSYDVTISVRVKGLVGGGEGLESCVTLDLKNPYFRYTGVTPPPPPPGHQTVSASEQYWQQVDTHGARQAVNLLNGMSVNGLTDVAMETNTAQNVLTMQPQQFPGSGVVMNQNTAVIHPGSIPAASSIPSVYKLSANSAATAGTVSAAVSAASSPPVIISSANQLIGGGTSPALLTAANSSARAVHAPAPAPFMIGDYVATVEAQDKTRSS